MLIWIYWPSNDREVDTIRQQIWFDLAYAFIVLANRLLDPFVSFLSHDYLFYFVQVALQLLSDREKSDLAQLVSTMVSYSITYKSMKPDVLPNGLRREVVDHLTLSIDPPMCDFINFKVWAIFHNF